MTSESLVALAVFALVGSITPGPNTLMLAATGASFGWRRGVPTALGVIIGFSLMVGIVALGLGAVVTASPAILQVLRIAGIGMLIWMAWKIARAPIANGDETNNKTANPLGFFPAAAFQWINPKAWLVAVSAVSTYYIAGLGPWSQSALFTSIFLAAAILSCFGWLAFGAAAGKFLSTRPAYARGFNYLMGALLLASIILIVT